MCRFPARKAGRLIAAVRLGWSNSLVALAIAFNLPGAAFAQTITEFRVGFSPWEITAGPDGALWFTENNGSRIGRITTTGIFTQFSINSNSSRSGSAVTRGITAGPDG